MSTAGVGNATAALFAGTLRKNDDSAGPSAFLHPYSVFQLFLAYFNGIVLLFGALCNATLFIILLKNRGLRKVRYFLAANLTFADLGLCAVNAPIFLYNASQQHYAAGQLGCTVHAVSQVLLCSQSVLTLTTITYERYLTVVKGTEFTGVAFLTFLPANWCFSAVLAAMPFLWVNNPYPLRPSGIYCSGGWYFADPYDVMFTVLGFGVITTGLCGITLMYRQIFKSVRENVRRLTGAGGQASWHLAGSGGQPNGTGGKGAHSAMLAIEQGVSGDVRATPNVPPTPVCGANGRIPDGAFTRRALSNENIIARVTLTVSSTFFACWGVYNLMFLLEMLTQRPSSPLLDGVAATLALCNSTCNPFLFLFDKNINSAVKDAIGVRYLVWKYGAASRLPRCETVRSNAASSPTSLAFPQHHKSAKDWFWRRQTLQRRPCWMDISVVVTVNNGVTAAAERKPRNRTVSRPANGGRNFGVELATLEPGAARLKQGKRFGREEKQSVDPDRFLAEAEKAGGDSQSLPKSSLSSAASSGSGERTLQPDDRHAGRAVSAITVPPTAARASHGGFAIVRKLERSFSSAIKSSS